MESCVPRLLWGQLRVESHLFRQCPPCALGESEWISRLGFARGKGAEDSRDIGDTKALGNQLPHDAGELEPRQRSGDDSCDQFGIDRLREMLDDVEVYELGCEPATHRADHLNQILGDIPARDPGCGG